MLGIGDTANSGDAPSEEQKIITSPSQGLGQASEINALNISSNKRDEVEEKALPDQSQTQNKSCLLWTAKIIVVLAMLTAVYLGKTYGSPSIEVKHIYDPVHFHTQSLNNFFNGNPEVAAWLQVSSSLLMDFSFLALCIYWLLEIKSSRVIVSMALFYVFRALNQALVIFPFPQGYFWDDPSFPALVTPYGRTSDFFYSGHVGFLNLCALEWYKQKKMWMCKVTWVINLYIMFVMLILRIHYTVDITTGLVVSHWIFMLVSEVVEKIDSFFSAIYKKLEKLLEPSRTEECYEEHISINV